MDNVVFLNSSGAIVSRTMVASGVGALTGMDTLGIVPYIENVTVPQLSADPNSLYGDHPENLVKLTVSSGGALTFFCDSVAGGDDSSGDGSYDNPWRSLNTASKFLACAECTLRAAAKHIQLKIKGDTSYVSGAWSPFSFPPALILTGWGTRCDLGAQASYGAGYMFNLAGQCAYRHGIYSNCVVSGGSIMDYQSAISCNMSHVIYITNPLYENHSIYYGCKVSGGGVCTSICYDCDLEFPAARGCFAYYYYNTSMSIQPVPSGYLNPDICYIGKAAVSTIISGGSISSVNDYFNATVISVDRNALLKDCTVNASFYRSGGIDVDLIGGYDEGLVVNGGRYIVNAESEVVGSTFASASVRINWNGTSAVVQGADLIFSGAAVATATDKSAWWSENETIRTTLFGNSCVINRHRDPHGTSNTSSGTCPLT